MIIIILFNVVDAVASVVGIDPSIFCKPEYGEYNSSTSYCEYKACQVGEPNESTGNCEYAATVSYDGGVNYTIPIYNGWVSDEAGLRCDSSHFSSSTSDVGNCGTYGYISAQNFGGAKPIYRAGQGGDVSFCVDTFFSLNTYDVGGCGVYGYIPGSDFSGGKAVYNGWGTTEADTSCDSYSFSADTSNESNCGIFGFISPVSGNVGGIPLYSCPNGGILNGAVCQVGPVCPNGGNLVGKVCQNPFIVSMPLSLSAYVNWEILPTAPSLQIDNWSCGIHSAYRLLKAYGQNENYDAMKNDIGAYSYNFNLDYKLKKEMERTVCTEWFSILFGPELCIATAIETYFLEEAGVANFNIPLSFGKPDKQLVNDLRRYRTTFKTADRQNLDVLYDLLNNGSPVMALIQVDTDSFSLEWAPFLLPGWELVGPSSLRFPKLHWIIINGHDAENIFWYDTVNDTQNIMSIQEFYRKWDWRTLEYDSISSDFFESQEDMHPRTLMWIDEQIPHPRISLSPQSASFGETYVNLDKTQYFEISNTGNKPLRIESIYIRDGNYGDYYIPLVRCWDLIAPNATCYFQTNFKPVSPGVKTSNLIIGSTDPYIPKFPATLNGIAKYPQSLVSTSGTGTGSVTSTPAGISCGSTCSASFATGTVVTLTATASADSVFAGWSGACSGTGSCVVTLSTDSSVTATFNILPPVAGFSASPTTGGDPLYISFTDQSQWANSWLWDFGDGTTSTAQSPSHMYRAAGTYTVSLTASNASGTNTATRTDYISVTNCGNQPVRIVGGASYDTIQAAYDAAVEGDVIQAHALVFVESLSAGSSKSVTIDGGYICDYSTNPGVTDISGAPHISAGTVRMKNIHIKQ